jgi:hypothetical protein
VYKRQPLTISSFDNIHIPTFSTPTYSGTDFNNFALRLTNNYLNPSQIYKSGPSILFSTSGTSNSGAYNVDHGWMLVGENSTSPSGFSELRVRLRTNVASPQLTGLTGVNIDAGTGYNEALYIDGNGSANIHNLNVTVNPAGGLTLDVAQNAWAPAGDLIITNSSGGGGYIGFYGVSGYKFPKTIGVTGQVLAVPSSGNLLQWTSVAGGGGGGVTQFTGLTDAPGPYQVADANSVVAVNSSHTGLVYTKTLTGLTLNSSVLHGNADTATALASTITISGVNFNGSSNITLTTDNIQESGSPTNLYFTASRARNSVSVASNKALSYSSGTGIFDLNESVETSANSLVKRDSSGVAKLATLQVDTLSNYQNSSIAVNSSLTGNFNLNTTGTLTAACVTFTGLVTINSTGVLTLTPGVASYIDATSHRIVNVATPSASGDATPKGYVDSNISAVSTASLTQIPVSGDTGGVVNVAKGTTVTILGGSNISTTTNSNGVTVALKSTISNVSVSGALPVTGNITSTGGYVKGGNIQLTGNTVTQGVTGNNLELVPGLPSGGTSPSILVNNALIIGNSLSSNWNVTANTPGILGIASYENVAIPANASAVALDVSVNMSFISTANWIATPTDLAYATLANGVQGQYKTIFMVSRGTYGTNNLTQAPRYLVVSGNINGASRQYPVGQTDANGTVTFVFLNGYWWRVSEVK